MTILINEFQPNPPGADPTNQTFELRGTPGTAFTGVLVSVESDAGSLAGIVDRVLNISGTFDANGVLSQNARDLENPSFTLFLLTDFTGTIGVTDIDTNNDGTADDLSTFGTVLDAIGVPDSTVDETFLYGAQLGGVDFAHIGAEPEIIFRASNTANLYAVKEINTTGVFDTSGTNVGIGPFNPNPTTGTTFGAINPSTTLEPEINVQGNGANIVDGSITPAIITNTDFGAVDTLTGSTTQTFVIQNTGIADLRVTDIALSGVHSADFTIQNFTAGIVAAGRTLTFDVVFNPGADGLRTATITVASNDVDEATYDFAIQGTGTTATFPEINVQGNSTDIVDGDITPATLDNTDFGNVDTDTSSVAKTFTIQNIGTTDLNVTGITVSGIDASDFTIQNFTAGTVTAGGTLTFDGVFDPTADGLRTATIEIASDDADEGIFDFAIQGTGTSIESSPATPVITPAITPAIIGIDRTNSDEDAGVVALLGSLTLSFAINNNETSFVNELVVFTVEDNSGTVLDANGNAITPTTPNFEQDAYLSAILDSQDTHVVFSTLNTSDNLPDAFTEDLSTLGTTLDFDSNTQLGFLLIADGTYDELQTNPHSTSFFLSTTGGADVDILSPESLLLHLGDDDVGIFDDLEISITATSQDTLLNQPVEFPKIGRSIRIQDDFVEAIDLLNQSFDFNGDGVVDELTGAAITVGIDVFREAAFDNLIGFFAIDPVTGSVNGILPTAANRLAYAEAAFNSAVGIVNSPSNESTLSITLTFTGDQVLLPFLIADGVTPNETFSNIYFPFLGLNSDGADHIRLLGNGVFGFEDLASGGDQDFDDVIIQITTVTLA